MAIASFSCFHPVLVYQSKNFSNLQTTMPEIRDSNQRNRVEPTSRYSSMFPSVGTPFVPARIRYPSFPSSSIDSPGYLIDCLGPEMSELATPTPVMGIDDGSPDGRYQNQLYDGIDFTKLPGSPWSGMMQADSPQWSNRSTRNEFNPNYPWLPPVDQSRGPLPLFNLPYPSFHPAHTPPSSPINMTSSNIFSRSHSKTSSDIIPVTMFPTIGSRVPKDPRTIDKSDGNMMPFNQKMNINSMGYDDFSKLITGINSLWNLFSMGITNNKDVVEFNYLVGFVLDLGSNSARVLANQRAFCAASPNSRGLTAFDFLNDEVKSRLNQAIVADLRHYLSEKKGFRFITMCMSKNEVLCDDIVRQIEEDCLDIFTDKMGSLAIQKIIGLLDVHHLRLIAVKIVDNCESLIDDPYANYVITKLINVNCPDRTVTNHYAESCNASDKKELRDFIMGVLNDIIEKLLPNLDKYCNGKFSSPVLEAIIKKSDDELRRKIEVFLLDGGNKSSRVEEYMNLKYANYVVQTSCDVCTDENHYKLFVEGIRGAVRNDRYSTKDRAANREAYVAKMLRKYNVSVQTPIEEQISPNKEAAR
eukprot:GHVH01017455.1.p1 GENE.GHVH01017455.1~~GHVH01017455.1.p1  ORF type:complete len:585 (+),score=80.71 GHVH01017455.1:277-2031(+)